MTKTHTQGNVKFHATGKIWNFTHPAGYSLRRDITGGLVNAEKVARIIDASFKRAEKAGRVAIEPDNLARANINDLLHKHVKTTGLQRVAMFPNHLFSHA
jgi:hypothetical protein